MWLIVVGAGLALLLSYMILRYEFKKPKPNGNDQDKS